METDFKTAAELAQYAEQQSHHTTLEAKTPAANKVTNTIISHPNLLNEKSALAVVTFANTARDPDLNKALDKHGQGVIKDKHFQNLSEIDGTLLESCATFVTSKTLALYAQQACNLASYLRQGVASRIVKIIEKNPDLLDKESALAVVQFANTANDDKLNAALNEHGQGSIDDTHFQDLSEINGTLLESCAHL